MPSTQLFHTGIVVPDIHGAVAAYSQGTGASFAAVKDITLDVIVDGEPRTERMFATYTRGGPPHVEFIQERSGGIWGEQHLNLNHVGYWTQDMAASKAALEAAGFRMRISTTDDPVRVCYLSGPGGIWVELVGPQIKPILAEWLQTTYSGPDADQSRGA